MTPLAAIICTAALATGQAEYQVLPQDQANPPQLMLKRYLVREAHQALDRRQLAYEQLKTPDDIRRYQKKQQAFFRRQLGGFPAASPLNSQVVGKLDGGNYRIEKIIYQSRARHHVTATLYLPKSKPPYPGVLIACGHTKSGKAAAYNQRMGILLAQNGIAALCYDPIGQGERSQDLVEGGLPKHKGSTTEHFMIGIGSILVGTNTAQYRTYDGIRGIDYLVSRDDIMADRIGCTGCSGGGTLTSYIMALDDRIACAAPACYLTTWRRLIDTIGPQDSEQNIFGQIAFGMDHPDYVIMRAPRPTLICSTTRDFFDIEGSWDNLRQSKRIYTRLGFAERVDLIEVDGTHGVTKPSREAMVRWMRRWLLKRDDTVVETEAKTWSEEALRCTPRGEVLLLPKERSVYDLNRERAQKLAEKRAAFWKASSNTEKRAKIRRLAGVAPLDKLPPARAVVFASIKKKDHTLHKLTLESLPGIKLPALAFVPHQVRGDKVLILDGNNKAAGIERIRKLVTQGHTVLAVDLRGIGETENGRPHALLGPDWKEFYLAYLLGKSMIGMRTEDILISARYLRDYGDSKATAVRLVANGEASIPALHAAALHPDLFAAIETSAETDSSWQRILATSEPANQFVNVVHNALAWYDLPQLRQLIGEVKPRTNR